MRPTDHLLKDIGIAIFINTNLFLGGLHQEFYNGGMKKRLLRYGKSGFQWSLFKNTFAVPVFT